LLLIGSLPSVSREEIGEGASQIPKRKSRYRHTTEELDAFARQLRKSMPPAEQRLWAALRRKQLDGLRFRRQVAFESYIVDFVCTDKRLIIEVDGDVHDAQIDYDAARTVHLEQYGYTVLRFRNDQVLNDLGTVLETIRKAAPSPSPSLETKGGG